MKNRREVWLHLMGHAMAGMYVNAAWRVAQRDQTRDEGRRQVIKEAAQSADDALIMFEDRFGHPPYDQSER